jgi:hypothetical protein
MACTTVSAACKGVPLMVCGAGLLGPMPVQAPSKPITKARKMVFNMAFLLFSNRI